MELGLDVYTKRGRKKKKGKIQQTNKAIRKNQGTKRYLANKQEISQTNSRGGSRIC
jgi:hypothetical protein